MTRVNAPVHHNKSPAYAAKIIEDLLDHEHIEDLAVVMGMTARGIRNLKNHGFKRYTTQVAFEAARAALSKELV